MENETQKQIEEIKELVQFLPEKKQEELTQILKYGEKIKKEGERKKKEWWSECRKWVTQMFFKYRRLLAYKWKHENELEEKYDYLDKMNKLEREKFIEEYLYDDMLYSIKSEEIEEKNEKRITYLRKDWEKGLSVLGEGEVLNLIQEYIGDKGMISITKNIELNKGVELNLSNNKIGFEGANAIAEERKNKLQPGMEINLSDNKIGDRGMEVIAKNVKLKEGMTLNVAWNGIGDKGVRAISQMKLEKGVSLNMGYNEFGIIGVKAIAENLKLQNGVWLNLCENKIGADGAKFIAENLKLVEGVLLDLSSNELGDKGAEIISKIKLKEGVVLDLRHNNIGDRGAEAIMHNMELKNGVTIALQYNTDGIITENMKQKLKDWEKSYHDKGINCKVLV